MVICKDSHLFEIASGLYFIALYIEDNPHKTKKYIKNALFTSIGAHIVLLFDGLPWTKVMFSVFCQTAYLPILNKQFPMVNASSPIAVLAALTTLGNHFLWFNHFMKSSKPLSEIVTFYTFIIWGIPLCLLVSMSNNTQGLPNFGTLRICWRLTNGF